MNATHSKPRSKLLLADLAAWEQENGEDNALRLERAGLDPERIAVSPECTACRSDKYWSHRVTGGERGSQAAVIQL